MTDRAALESVLAWPSLASRRWEASPLGFPNSLPSHSGLDGEVWLLRADDGAMRVVKRRRAEDTAIAFSTALAAAQRAADHGLGPRVLDHDDALEAILFEHPGQGWRSAGLSDLLAPGTLAKAATGLRQFHAQPHLARPAPEVRAAMAQADRIAGDRLGALVSAWQPLREWVARIEPALQSGAPDAVPLHREVFASNFLIGPHGDLLLIDFDHAADGDPMADLAALALETAQVDDEHDTLINLYFGRTSPHLLARLRLHAILEDVRWGCWAWERYASPSAPAIVDYLTYARMRLGRALHHVTAWNAGDRLGEIAHEIAAAPRDPFRRSAPL
ncbi:aminoglycoside phosphotransferase family protein [Novosphingobium sp. 1949]|uniref:Aminoglycoside phosphotransferase family protein n=1 Tax=Novosphingobium organovorum TaxID=2930092 RepID=A0ABT0BC26_9SPHN|nr:phosphotransferase [Novosphingobium organovorum]MCJ2182529.1 aminoglycoside phosphotransferase family protein [Novosphingobium organovorum]